MQESWATPGSEGKLESLVKARVRKKLRKEKGKLKYARSVLSMMKGRGVRHYRCVA
jgi:hypothetical protein